MRLQRELTPLNTYISTNLVSGLSIITNCHFLKKITVIHTSYYCITLNLFFSILWHLQDEQTVNLSSIDYVSINYVPTVKHVGFFLIHYFSNFCLILTDSSTQLSFIKKFYTILGQIQKLSKKWVFGGVLGYHLLNLPKFNTQSTNSTNTWKRLN